VSVSLGRRKEPSSLSSASQLFWSLFSPSNNHAKLCPLDAETQASQPGSSYSVHCGSQMWQANEKGFKFDSDAMRRQHERTACQNSSAEFPRPPDTVCGGGGDGPTGGRIIYNSLAFPLPVPIWWRLSPLGALRLVGSGQT